MRLYILINTYKRPQQLVNLLANIIREKGNYEITVAIYNDGDDNYGQIEVPLGSTLKDIEYTLCSHHGKKRYWQLVSMGFQKIEHTDYDYYFMLPDDVTLCNGFFTNAIQTWQRIKDNRKICLSVLLDSRIKQRNWTNKRSMLKTFDKHKVYLTQWVDMAFIAEKKFFQQLDFMIFPINRNRWREKPFISSGVGQQISLRLLVGQFNMYHVVQTLIYHGEYLSVMHPQERQQNTLKT